MAAPTPFSTPANPAPSSPGDSNAYRELSIEKVISTLRKLQFRIKDRFPDSGLLNVCGELLEIASESKKKIQGISRPIFSLRIGATLLILLCVFALIFSIASLGFSLKKMGMAEIVQVFEASSNDLIIIGAAFFFLFTIEGRIKRSKALVALHELRAIAHVIDMHQLTKDPSRGMGEDTEHSPVRDLDPFQLTRYLDYCSEMLALTGKVSALYAQAFPDPVVLQTINELEILTSGMSHKVWQKIMILDRITGKPGEGQDSGV